LRRVERHQISGNKNSMQYWHRVRSPLRVIFNFIVITLCRYIPFLGLKNFLYRHCLGMKIGDNVSVGLMAMVDVFFPELISIGSNSVIGYNVTILTHEFLVPEFRKGRVEIGPGVLIGSNTTVLPGVSIGAGAEIGAHSLVNRDIPPGVLAGGVPARVIGTSRQNKA